MGFHHRFEGVQEFRRLVIAALGYCVICMLTSVGIQTTDDLTTQATVASLVDRQQLHISHLAPATEAISLDHFGKYGREGNLYSKYGIGQVLVSIPFYELGCVLGDGLYIWRGIVVAQCNRGMGTMAAVNPLMAAAALAVLGWFIRLYWKANVALSVCALGLATPWFLAARGFGTEVGAGLFLLLSCFACYKRRPTLGACLVCLAGLFRPPSMVFGVAWVVFLADHTRRTKAACIVSFATGVLLLAIYNYVRFESFFETGYARDIVTFRAHLVGLLGLLFSPGRSILLFVPLTIGLIPAITLARSCGDRLVLGTVLGVVAFVLLHAMWTDWHGGWSYGPRLLIPIVPLVVFVVSPLLGRWWGIVALLVGGFIQAITLTIDPLEVLGRALYTESVSFGETLWTLRRNPIVLQIEAIDTGIVWLLVIISAVLLSSVWGRAARAEQGDRPGRAVIDKADPARL